MLSNSRRVNFLCNGNCVRGIFILKRNKLYRKVWNKKKAKTSICYMQKNHKKFVNIKCLTVKFLDLQEKRVITSGFRATVQSSFS